MHFFSFHKYVSDNSYLNNESSLLPCLNKWRYVISQLFTNFFRYYQLHQNKLECCNLLSVHLLVSFPVLLQLSPKASLTASLSVKARSATVTARSPRESPRIATAKSLLTGETETETKTKTKIGGTAMSSQCPTDVIVKTVLVAVQMHHPFAGIVGTMAAVV